MRQAFYLLSEFPELQELQESWQIIKSELIQLTSPHLNIGRHGKTIEQVFVEVNNHINNGGEYGWVKGLADGGWWNFGMLIEDEPIPYIENLMPKTLNILKKLAGIKICALSKMNGPSLIPEHSHPEIHEENLLQFHITLETPKNSPNSTYLNVNGEFCQNIEGKSIIFDGSLNHFAVNASNQDRTILYIEFYKDKLRLI